MTASETNPQSTQSPAQVKALRQRLQRLIRDTTELDMPETDSVDQDLRFWELEPEPVVVDAAEWSTISAALVQRARLTNAFLRDIYDNQDVLQAKQLPPEVILGDARYRRPCLKLEADRIHPATVLRFDLCRTTAGWAFTGVHANTPIGISYAVQNRRFLSQEAPQLYAALPDFHSIINFPLELLESLRRLSPRGPEEASIVLLTSGPQDPFFSEHAFLARKMGVPLARGDDLLVLDNRVFMKTIAGLEQVDVIYRRLDDAHIDPVVFSTAREGAGVPGLLQAVRQKTVVVANAIGTGIAESRALDAYHGALCRFYLGEPPLLPSLPTYLLSDTDQVEAALAEHGVLTLREAQPYRGMSSPLPEPQERSVRSLREIPSEATIHPVSHVLQADAARRVGGRTATTERPLAISGFVLSRGDSYIVLPGGLVRSEPSKAHQQRIGRIADLVVLQGEQSSLSSSQSLTTGQPQPARTALGSRSAENLYWLGRYLERAESTARMLAIVDDVALEEIPARDRVKWLPVWQGLLEATGHAGEMLSRRSAPQFGLAPELTWRMSLDRHHPSSIYSSVEMARENARLLRDCISPEVWVVLNHLQEDLRTMQHRSHDAQDAEAREAAARAAVEAVLTGVNALLGTAERTLLQDATWHFLLVGLHLERAIMTCSALRHCFTSLEQEVIRSPQLADRQNPELSALVRMLGSQDAYRRLYQTVSTPRLVAELFLKQPAAPRSLLHNLLCISENLTRIQEEIHRHGEWTLDAVSAEVNRLIESLRNCGVSEDGTSGTSLSSLHALGAQFFSLLQQLYSLHTHLSDHYFSHQARM
jgi:uncharacterized circularly permuted ATP-grasp superfamily protein/uncharacterized alpha-E superfamily protein